MIMTKPDIDTRLLTKDIVRDNVDLFIEMSKQLKDDYWVLDHYLTDYNRKWELSLATYCNEDLCGFIIVSEKPESLHVHRIVVSEAFQNFGIGKMLIGKVIHEAQQTGKNAITLKAESANHKTISFYKNLNFQITGYQGDLVLMTLKMAL